MESEMSFCERIKFAFSKLALEFIGTFFLTCLYLEQAGTGGSQAILLLGLWVLTIFCWKISQSHLNPAVTLAFILRHDSKKIHPALGLLIIGA